MQVKIFHKDEGALVHVANYTYESGPIGSNADRLDAILEAAYHRTQNIAGSWSKGPELQEPGMMKIENHDYCAQIERVAPLHEVNGKVYGLRSSMVGDIFEIEGRKFTVASFGFEELAKEEI